MKELRDAARACGLNLDGIELRPSEKSPRDASIAWLRQGPHGHFVVVRPVGHTGKLVQVIDLSERIEIVDASQLYSSSAWTGLVLMKRRRAAPFLTIGAVCVVTLVISRVVLAKIRHRCDRAAA